MNIIELANQSGFFADESKICISPHQYDPILNGNIAKELQAFATAIIENYKAGLVPVAEVAQETFGDGQVIWFKEYPEDGTKLYALGETK